MNIKIVSIIAFSLLLSACTKTVPNSSETKNDLFSSIQDAVNKDIALKCDYTDGEETTTTYIKGQVVRLVGNNQSAGVEGLMKDNKFYLWSSLDNDEKTGMIIDITKMDGAKMGDTPIKSISDVVTELEKAKEKCTVISDSASMFEIPTDIKFSEVSDIFESTE